MTDFYFHCSDKTKDIENEKVFNSLASDEIVELLMEDPNYMNWMTVNNMKNLNKYDTVYLAVTFPQFLSSPQFKYKMTVALLKLKQYDWRYIVHMIPEFINILSDFNYKWASKVKL